MMQLIKQRKPIRVWLRDEYLGVYEFNEELKRYEGLIGNLSIDKIIDILNGKIDFIKIEPYSN